VSTLTFPLSLTLGPCVTLTRIEPLVFSVFYATLFGNTWEVDHNRATFSLSSSQHYCVILFLSPHFSPLYFMVMLLPRSQKLKINIFVFKSYYDKFFYYIVTLRYTPCKGRRKVHNSKNNSTNEWLCVFSTKKANEEKCRNIPFRAREKKKTRRNAYRSFLHDISRRAYRPCPAVNIVW